MATIEFDVPEICDAKIAEEGVWHPVYDARGNHRGDFKCAYFDDHSRRVKLAQERINKKYERAIRSKTADFELIVIEVFLEACLLDWRGVTAKGKEVPFDKAVATSFFTDIRMRPVAEDLIQKARSPANYDRLDRDEVAGN